MPKPIKECSPLSIPFDGEDEEYMDVGEDEGRSQPIDNQCRALHFGEGASRLITTLVKSPISS